MMTNAPGCAILLWVKFSHERVSALKKFFQRIGWLWCVGLAAFVLRLLQNRLGFDPATGLSVPSLPGKLLPALLGLCALAQIFLCLRLPRGKASFTCQFAPPDQELFIAIMGSVTLAAGGVMLLVEGGMSQGLAAIAAGVLGAASGVGIFLLVRRQRAGDEPGPFPVLPALFFGVFFVLTIYLPAESDPVLARFYLPVLGAALTAYAFSQLAGFFHREGSPRLFVCLAGLAVVACLGSVPDGTNMGQKLLFIGCALVLSAFLLMRREEPLPEPEKEEESPAGASEQ